MSGVLFDREFQERDQEVKANRLDPEKLQQMQEEATRKRGEERRERESKTRRKGEENRASKNLEEVMNDVIGMTSL